LLPVLGPLIRSIATSEEARDLTEYALLAGLTAMVFVGVGLLAFDNVLTELFEGLGNLLTSQVARSAASKWRF